MRDVLHKVRTSAVTQERRINRLEEALTQRTSARSLEATCRSLSNHSVISGPPSVADSDESKDEKCISKYSELTGTSPRIQHIKFDSIEDLFASPRERSPRGKNVFDHLYNDAKMKILLRHESPRPLRPRLKLPRLVNMTLPILRL